MDIAAESDWADGAVTGDKADRHLSPCTAAHLTGKPKNDIQRYKIVLSPEAVEYRLHRLYSIDLDSVRHSLRLIRRYRRNDIRFCVFRELVITYARPFSGSRRPDARRYHFPSEFVPSEIGRFTMSSWSSAASCSLTLTTPTINQR